MTVVLTLARSVIAVTTGLVALVVVGLAALGWRPVMLVSGSMDPYAPAGSVVVAEPVTGEEVVVGDVVTARPDGAALPVTHRVVAIERTADGAVFATLQGDANEGPDREPVRLDDRELLRGRWVVEDVGHLLGENAAQMLVGLAAIVGGLLGLLWLWLPPRRVNTAVAGDLAQQP